MQPPSDINAIIDKLRQAAEAHDAKARDSLHGQLLAAANAQPEAFTRTVAAIAPTYGGDENLFEIYWALAPAAPHWRPFFLAELERLLALAETADRNTRRTIRTELWGMTAAVEKDAELWASLRDRLWRDVASSRPETRRFALILLNDLSPNDGDTVLIPRLDSLRADPDWRIRYLARYFANDFRRRPLSEGIPFLDTLRATFSDPKRP